MSQEEALRKMGPGPCAVLGGRSLSCAGFVNLCHVKKPACRPRNPQKSPRLAIFVHCDLLNRRSLEWFGNTSRTWARSAWDPR